MSQEHDLAKEARKALLDALTAWMFSVQNKTLTPEEQNLYDKGMTYFRFKRVTSKYKVPSPSRE